MTKNKFNRKMDRRKFLKLSGGAVSLATLGGMFPGFVEPSLVEKPTTGAADKQDGWYPGPCKMCMQGDCVMHVHVVDGAVVEIEGNKRAPNNEGTLCPLRIMKVRFIHFGKA